MTFGGDDNVLEIYIGYLRKKLEAGGLPSPDPHRTGVGYVVTGGIVSIRLRFTLLYNAILAVTLLDLQPGAHFHSARTSWDTLKKELVRSSGDGWNHGSCECVVNPSSILETQLSRKSPPMPFETFFQRPYI